MTVETHKLWKGVGLVDTSRLQLSYIWPGRQTHLCEKVWMGSEWGFSTFFSARLDGCKYITLFTISLPVCFPVPQPHSAIVSTIKGKRLLPLEQILYFKSRLRLTREVKAFSQLPPFQVYSFSLNTWAVDSLTKENLLSKMGYNTLYFICVFVFDWIFTFHQQLERYGDIISVVGQIQTREKLKQIKRVNPTFQDEYLSNYI